MDRLSDNQADVDREDPRYRLESFWHDTAPGSFAPRPALSGDRDADVAIVGAGYTGLGVGASRFGARVALDLIDGQETERTGLAMVRRSPFPFPPEPLRWVAIQATRRALQRSDRRGGRRGTWLSLLDRFGIGFDS